MDSGSDVQPLNRLSAMAPASSHRSPATPSIRERVGVAHVAGDYHFTDGDFLNEGADELLKLGTRTIKIWFKADMNASYPFGPRFIAHASLVDLAKTGPMRKLFAKPFTTYVLETYAPGRSDHYWKRGMTPEEVADERRQFRELARYLLKTYNGKGKTFILQHWEGDWAIRNGYDPNEVPSRTAIDGMARWLNARQDGVEDARQSFFGTRFPRPGSRRVGVYHAAEVNLVVPAMEGKTSVTNDVLPHTRCDLYSYSSYETSIQGDRFLKALDHLSSKAPDSAIFGAKNLYVGEFGVPEREFGADFAVKSLKRTLEDGLRWGLRYLIYWQVYDNECKKIPAVREEECRGFWLITPTGRRSELYDFFRSVYNNNHGLR
jgi:hypothetical protein